MKNVFDVFCGNLTYDTFYFYYRNNPIMKSSAVEKSIENIQDENTKSVAMRSFKEAMFDIHQEKYRYLTKKWDPDESTW